MQDSILWGVIGTFILLLLIVAIFVRRKYPRPTDYYSFFWIGIALIIFGIPMAFFLEDNYFFLIMGLVFAAIGFANKKKWKKNKTRWKDLKKPEKIIQGILIVFLAFVLAVGIAFLLIRTKGLI
ncbi:MAG: hypothetical protein V1759_04065 [bacterium]